MLRHCARVRSPSHSFTRATSAQISSAHTEASGHRAALLNRAAPVFEARGLRHHTSRAGLQRASAAQATSNTPAGLLRPSTAPVAWSNTDFSANLFGAHRSLRSPCGVCNRAASVRSSHKRRVDGFLRLPAPLLQAGIFLRVHQLPLLPYKPIGGTFKEHSRTYSERAGNIQGIFKEHSGENLGLLLCCAPAPSTTLRLIYPECCMIVWVLATYYYY